MPTNFETELNKICSEKNLGNEAFKNFFLFVLNSEMFDDNAWSLHSPYANVNHIAIDITNDELAVLKNNPELLARWVETVSKYLFAMGKVIQASLHAEQNGEMPLYCNWADANSLTKITFYSYTTKNQLTAKVADLFNLGNISLSKQEPVKSATSIYYDAAISSSLSLLSTVFSIFARPQASSSAVNQNSESAPAYK